MIRLWERGEELEGATTLNPEFGRAVTRNYFYISSSSDD